MKLTMTRVLTPLAALAFTLGAQATDFAKDDFEGAWSNATGGYSFTPGPDAAADATAQYTYDGDAPAAALSPIGGATNLKGLKLSTEDGILFRNLTDAGVGASGLYVDTDVQFTITDAADRPTPVTTGDDTDKFIIWLEADDVGNTNLCVWAREYHLDNGALAANSNKVYKLNSSAIAPGSWHRLTVKAIAQINDETTPIPGFQVYLDSTLLSSSDAMFPSEEYTACWDELPAAAKALADAATFFPAMSDGLGSLAKVGFSGEGKIDDFVVTDDIPSALPRVALTVNWDDSVVSNVTFLANGGSKTLTSSGSLLTLEPDTTVSFSMENITPAAGVNLEQYSLSENTDDWVLTGVADVSVAAGVATVGGETGNGAFTIALNRNTASAVTIDWVSSGIAAGSIASVSYTIDGTTETVLGTEGYTMFDAELDDVITISVTLAQGVTGVPQITATTGATGSGSTFTLTGNTAEFTIALATPVATVDGTSYATFAEAFAAAKTAGEPVVLSDDIALDATQVIDVKESVTIDLNGYTITGAAGVAAFANAANLTITDTSLDHDGSVVAGTGGLVVANTGTLELVYGSYEGAFTNDGDFVISTDCEFDNDLTGAYEAAAGYEVAETGEDTGVFKLKLLIYTITYYNGDQLLDVAPASYTVEDTITLTNEVDLAVFGVSFQAWTNAEGTVVAGWSAGDKTGNQTFYAQTAAVVPPSGETIEPGEQSTASFDTQEEAEAAAANITIAASDAVTNALDSAAQTAYLDKFEKKVVADGEGHYKVEIALTAAAEAELADDATTNVAVAVAAQLPTVAASAAGSQTDVAVTGVEPGFYYSISYGTAVNAITTEGPRVLAGTSGEITLQTPAKASAATSGFYRINVNVAPAP